MRYASALRPLSTLPRAQASTRLHTSRCTRRPQVATANAGLTAAEAPASFEGACIPGTPSLETGSCIRKSRLPHCISTCNKVSPLCSGPNKRDSVLPCQGIFLSGCICHTITICLKGRRRSKVIREHTFRPRDCLSSAWLHPLRAGVIVRSISALTTGEYHIW